MIGYELKREGGCWCDCSNDYCTGVDYHYSDLPIYLSLEAAKNALKEISEKEDYRILNNGMGAGRISNHCAMERCGDNISIWGKDINENDYQNCVELDTKEYPSIEEIVIIERTIIAP